MTKRIRAALLGSLIWAGIPSTVAVGAEQSFFGQTESVFQVVVYTLVLSRDTVESVEATSHGDGELGVRIVIRESEARRFSEAVDQARLAFGVTRVSVLIGGQVIYNGLSTTGGTGDTFLLGPLSKDVQQDVLNALSMQRQ